MVAKLAQNKERVYDRCCGSEAIFMQTQKPVEDDPQRVLCQTIYFGLCSSAAGRSPTDRTRR